MKYDGVRSIAKNTSYLAGAHAFTGLVRGIYAIILARFLGPEMYGLFNYGLSWYLAFLPVSILGLHIILGSEVGKDRGEGARVVARTLALRTLLTLSTAVACGGIGWFVEGPSKARYLLLVFSFALLGRSLSHWTNSVFTAYESSKYNFQQEAAFRLVEIAAGLIVLLAHGSLMALAIVHTSAWWLQGIRGLILVRRHIVPVYPEWAWKKLSRLFVQGVPLGLSEVLMVWLMQGPVVLYRHIIGIDYRLGQLALAMQAFFILCGIPWALGSAALPVLTRAVAREDGKDRLFADGMVRFGWLIGAIAGLAGMAVGPEIVGAIFGVRYELAGDLLGPTLWLLVPLTGANAMSRVLLARGRFVLPAACAGMGAVVLTGTFPFLAYRIGIYGAVLSAGMGMVVWMACLVLSLMKAGDIHIHRIICRPALAVLTALGAYLSLKPVSVWFAFPASLVVLFAGSLLLRVITPEERSALANLTAEAWPLFRKPRS